MKLALSNFAWDNPDSEKIFNIIKLNGFNQIEGVLTKLNDWENTTLDTISTYKKTLDTHQIKITSLQSLFYNFKCSNITEKELFISHFKTLINYSKILSVNVLVFGSPNLRKKIIGWEKIVSDIFKELDILLDDTNIEICIEPNSKIYGGEFFITIDEIVEFIKNNKLKNIKTMIDTHNLQLEGYDPIIELNKHYNYISHIHISEVKLTPILNSETHTQFSNEIKKLGYNKTITYEILKCDNIETEIKKFVEIYN
jgi:sugar phosphate isomerase/epimerase